MATPSLLVDLATAERNIGRAADYYRNNKVKLRPHFKAHKMSALMQLQIDAGGCSGVTCATPYEAEVLANAGIDNILVANQIADPAGWRRWRVPRRRSTLPSPWTAWRMSRCSRPPPTGTASASAYSSRSTSAWAAAG